MNAFPPVLPMRRSVCLVALLLLGAQALAVLPKGRSILRNGDFSHNPKQPTYWVTPSRDKIGRFALLPPPEEGGSRILSVEVHAPSETPWDLQLRQTLAEPIYKGDVLFITFEYKLTPGYAFYCYWQKEEAPWPKLLSARFSEPENEWQKCAMAVPAQDDLPPRRTSLIFHLAEKKGTVQFRNFGISALPSHISLASLPTTHNPVFGGDYYDLNWRNTASRRIEELRKGNMAVKVVENGQPVPEAVVRIEQQTRQFHFGTDVSAPFLLDDAAEQPELAEFAEQLEALQTQLPKYRAKILEPRLFNALSLAQAFTWNHNVAWGDAIGARVVDALRAQGKHLLGHSLYCPAFRFAPPESRQLEDEQLWEALEAYVRAQMTKYKGKVTDWIVLRAPLTFEEFYDRAGVETLFNVFKVAQASDPEARLLLGDDKSLSLPSEEHLAEMLALVRWLREEGARIDGLALEAHVTRPYIAPQAIEQRLDRIAEATKLPIIIRSLALESPNESIQADRLESLLTLFFSHPAVNGVYLGGIWAAGPPSKRAALFRQNFAIKPAGKMFEKLLTEDWWTDETLKTDATGAVTLSAFLGSYQVTAELGTKRASQTLTLGSEGADFALELREAPAEE